MSNRPLHTLSLPPATLAALTRAGYETSEDLAASTPEDLARDARISLMSSQAVFSATQVRKAPLQTQSASHMTERAARKYSSGSTTVDRILGDGFQRGSVLELSGPPGAISSTIAVNLAREFVKDGEGVVFADMHNSVTATQLLETLQLPDAAVLPQDYRSLVTHTSLFSLTDVLLFLHRLPTYLEARHKTRLLVLNSFSLAFHSLSPNMSNAGRSVIQDRIRQALAHACASAGLSVVVATQLSTKLLNADGASTTFNDAGARAVMVPQPGNAYLPGGRSYRLMIVPRSRETGTIQLLSSPTHSFQTGQPPIREEPYELVGGPHSFPSLDIDDMLQINGRMT